MQRPMRRYTFALAERLGRTVAQLLDNISSSELAEWIAYDKTLDKEWVEKFNHEQELERQEALSLEERSEMLKKLFGG